MRRWLSSCRERALRAVMGAMAKGTGAEGQRSEKGTRFFTKARVERGKQESVLEFTG